MQIVSVRCRDVNQGGEKEKTDSLSNPWLKYGINQFLYYLISIVLKDPCGQQPDLVLEQPDRI